MRRNAGLFVAISLLSGFGSSAMTLVAGIWILDLTGSTGLAALAGLCVYAPVLAGPWLGGLLDRAPRRPLVIAVNLVLAAALLALLAVRGPGQTWLIFTVSCAYGVSYVLIDAGESALLPSALSPTELGDVNGWRSSAQEGMKLVAPLAGAGLYAWHGGHAVVVLSAAMPVLVATLYAVVRLNRTPSGPSAPRRSGLRTGLSVLFGQRVTRIPVTLAAVSIAMSGFTTAAIYAVVITKLRLPTTFLGVLASAQGAGSVIGGLIVGRLLARRGPVAVGVAGTVLFALGLLARCLPWWPVTVAGALVAGIGLPWTLVAAVTAVQTHTPSALLGRVSATANTAMFGPLVVAIPLGAAAVHLGARPPLVAAAAICLAAVVVTVKFGATGGYCRTMPLSPDEVELFEHSRARLEAIAYRLLGSASDAEDAVQDTFLRWQAADRERVETPEAWLTKVLTNLCLNQLTSARARRETYVGTWLPEPVLAGDRMLGPLDTAEQRESVSVAVLTLLERLSANERVVYVLRAAFDYSHGEIGEILGLTESNCQQIYRRAKQHVAAERARTEVDQATARKIVAEFLTAAQHGEIQRLVELLADDVTSTGDGGGKIPARTTPFSGALAVAKFLRGLFKPADIKRDLIGGSPALYVAVVNGSPAAVVVMDDRVIGVMSLEVTPEGVAAIHAQVNPDKLVRATRQWSTADHGEPLMHVW